MDARTIIVKVGTSVVSRPDGSLALGRIGSVVEQIAQLVKEGRQVVLVASGAIGIGAGKLAEQAMLSKSIRSHLHGVDPKGENSSARARAAAGQGGLMGLYDTLFSQYGLVCGQVLVTEADFSNKARLDRMRSTLQTMLRMGAVPVMNENDVLAMPDRRKLFKDNDSLAVLIALELRAQLLLLLSDVAGVWRGPPPPGQAPDVVRILTRDTKINYGVKSARGRGGMEAKVEAALDAVDRGVGAVVIASGFEQESALRIVAGEPLGTFVLRRDHPLARGGGGGGGAGAGAAGGAGGEAAAVARAARGAARALQQLSYAERGRVLHAVAAALEAAEGQIGAANAKDIAAAEAAGMTGAMKARLYLPPKKLKTVCEGIRAIAAQADPLGRVSRRVEIADGLRLTQESVPIGVLLVIFESRPDVLPQVAALAIASANGLLLKGGKEAVHTNRVLHSLIVGAVERASGGRVKRDVVALVEGREAIANLLTLNKEIDLCIPRGSNAMVQHIMGSTKIPTLGHADGICHMYIDASADPDKAARLAVDAKTDYPAACNAIETLLLHDAVATGPRKAVGQRVIADLRAAGVKLFGGPRAAKALGLPPAASLRHEYGELAIAVETVSGADAAIDHVNAHGSGHTDVVVAEDAKVAEAFMSRVDSADVFHNCSSAPPARPPRNSSALAILRRAILRRAQFL